MHDAAAAGLAALLRRALLVVVNAMAAVVAWTRGQAGVSGHVAGKEPGKPPACVAVVVTRGGGAGPVEAAARICETWFGLGVEQVVLYDRGGAYAARADALHAALRRRVTVVEGWRRAIPAAQRGPVVCLACHADRAALAMCGARGDDAPDPETADERLRAALAAHASEPALAHAAPQLLAVYGPHGDTLPLTLDGLPPWLAAGAEVRWVSRDTAAATPRDARLALDAYLRTRMRNGR